MTKRLLMTLLGPMLLTLFYPQSGFSQSSEEQLKALREEIEALKENQRISQELRFLERDIDALQDGQRALQKDLQDIKTLLQARPAVAPSAEPKNAVLTVGGAPSKGEKTAKLTLVEFTDFQ
jgi:hypothetical protein